MSDFQNMEILGGGKSHDRQNALLCQILRRSVKQLLRHRDFSIFKDGGSRQLAFLNF